LVLIDGNCYTVSDTIGIAYNLCSQEILALCIAETSSSGIGRIGISIADGWNTHGVQIPAVPLALKFLDEIDSPLSNGSGSLIGLARGLRSRGRRTSTTTTCASSTGVQEICGSKSLADWYPEIRPSKTSGN
jgi:hypothetical protein